jgi:hypothetical protein
MELVLYEVKAKYDLWVKILLAFVPALLIALGLLIYYGVLPTETDEEARESLIILFASTAFVLALFWVILPRKYQILQEKLKIVLGRPFSLNIPFDTIKTVKDISIAKASTYFGLKFSTSLKNTVEIIRKRGMNVIVSPSNRDLFLENLDKALADWRKSHSA